MGKASEIWKEIKPKIGEMLMAVNNIKTQAEKAQEEAYQRGLSDAWEAARKIQDTGGNLNWWIHNTSASEAAEKARQYEQEKEEQKQIQVGDEVKCIRAGWTAIVTKIKGDGYLTLMGNDGEIANGYDEKDFIKTGRRFPEIAEVLQKMRENNG